MSINSKAISRCFRVLELEAALLDTEAPSASDIYAICKGQSVPANLRPDVWLACLYVTDRGDQLSQFNEVYDLPEQHIIRNDCQQLVGEYIERIYYVALFTFTNNCCQILQRNLEMMMKIKSLWFPILSLY